MADFLHTCSLAIVPRAVAWLMRIWFGTCRVRVLGNEVDDIIKHHEHGIIAFWHYSFLFNFYYLRSYSAAVMVSASRDGEYIARLAELMGHVPVRGSSNQRGFRALREIIEMVRQGQNGAIVADGSQGPARQAQAGCILTASKSGQRIFPMVWAASRYIRFNSWDHTLVPTPFSTVVIHHGEPFFVPEKLSSELLETYRKKLEDQLNAMYDEAWREVGLPPHDGVGSE